MKQFDDTLRMKPLTNVEGKEVPDPVMNEAQKLEHLNWVKMLLITKSHRFCANQCVNLTSNTFYKSESACMQTCLQQYTKSYV